MNEEADYEEDLELEIEQDDTDVIDVEEEDKYE